MLRAAFLMTTVQTPEDRDKYDQTDTCSNTISNKIPDVRHTSRDEILVHLIECSIEQGKQECRYPGGHAQPIDTILIAESPIRKNGKDRKNPGMRNFIL